MNQILILIVAAAVGYFVISKLFDYFNPGTYDEPNEPDEDPVEHLPPEPPPERDYDRSPYHRHDD